MIAIHQNITEITMNVKGLNLPAYFPHTKEINDQPASHWFFGASPLLGVF